MSDINDADGHMSVTIKRNSKKKAGFEVEKRRDGFYYITKVPKNCKKIGVGDRVLEINGTMFEEFKNEKNANDLVDSIRLEVAQEEPDDEDDQEDESEEEYEEVDRSRPAGRNGSKRAATKSSEGDYENGGNEWNDAGEMKNGEVEWGSESFNNKDHSSTSFQERASIKSLTDETWERSYVSKYKPNERFMISVTKKEEDDDDDLGVDFVEFEESEIYVSDVNKGPFYDTALNRGDKILSINGKKIPDHLSTVEEAMEILYSKPKITLFVLRPKKSDEGYNWVHDMHEQ